MKNDEIVNKNLELLINEGYQMLLRESFGGNAGYNNGNPCAGLNFKFDETTGEITYFGNQPPTNGIFRVELDQNSWNLKIIGIYVREEGMKYVDISSSHLDEYVKGVLIKTAEEFNNREASPTYRTMRAP